jgi:murein DD-endopeptidase MepM/ murein hydrolase activator NlpD
MNRKIYIVVGAVLFIIGGTTWFFWHKDKNAVVTVATPTPTPQTSPLISETTPSPSPPPAGGPTPTPAATASSTPTPLVTDPIADFKSRITKKFFGTYVTPTNSPVNPEKFTGYHTGVDVEYGDVSTDVPVYAVAAGEVITSRTASGYGGVVAIKHTLNGKSVVTIYGHLAPSSLIANGKKVNPGDKIGILGKAYSSETDGERKHLHFGIVKGSAANIKGYVSSKDQLSGWYDPLDFHP